MNYLAHLFLADEHPQSLIGNLAGDFVKGPISTEFTPHIRRGIQLHRRIDSYTDAHPEVRQMKSLFSGERRRFAGVILDIGFDYFLSRNWEHYSDHDLHAFIDSVYTVLRENDGLLPDGLRRIAPLLVAGDWLGCYQTLEGTGQILDRVAKRFKRKNTLVGSVAEIEANHAQLEAGFMRLFPDVIAFADTQKRLLGQS